MNAIEARMLNHNMNAYDIHRLMVWHAEKAAAAVDSGVVDPCGNGTVPRPFKTAAIKKIAGDQWHYAFSAVVDSIDSVMGTIPAEYPTDSLRGSEERVETYMKRHERGEQLYHPRDNPQRIQIKCQH